MIYEEKGGLVDPGRTTGHSFEKFDDSPLGKKKLLSISEFLRFNPREHPKRRF